MNLSLFLWRYPITSCRKLKSLGGIILIAYSKVASSRILACLDLLSNFLITLMTLRDISVPCIIACSGSAFNNAKIFVMKPSCGTKVDLA